MGLITAIRTLTIFPVPGKDSEEFSSSLPWFPFVGLLLGLILYAAAEIWTRLTRGCWPWGGAAVLLTVGIISTRGLHLDGLADWADSIGGNRERETRLAIMKDSRIGAFGVLALIIVLTIKLIALERLVTSGFLIGIPIAFVLSRDMMVELITTLPYGRTEEGMAKPFVNQASHLHRFISHGVCLGFCISLGIFGVLLFSGAWVITLFFRSHCRRKFGGITGDLLGTLNELIEAILLFVCALPWEGLFLQ